MRNIKVCHIITMLELGGAQRNTLFTVEHLDKTKFTTLLITGPCGILDKEAAHIPGIKTFFVPEIVRQINPLNDLMAVYKIYNILKAERPDIVHTHSSKAGILGRIAAWMARTPVIIHTYHGFGFNDFQNIFVKYTFIFVELLTNIITTKFIAVTKMDILKGVKYGIGSSSKYFLIRSGIDVSKYSANKVNIEAVKEEINIPVNAPLVTTIGPFKPQKNLADFIKACALIAAGNANAYFVMIGDGEQRPAIESLIKALKIESRVKLLSWRNDIERILAATDVFVMTSLWEGLPRAIVEAMCAGKPVVANAVDHLDLLLLQHRQGQPLVDRVVLGHQDAQRPLVAWTAGRCPGRDRIRWPGRSA